MAARMAKRTAAGVGLAIWMLAGCTTPTPVEIDHRAALHDFESRRLDDPRLLAFLQQQGATAARDDGHAVGWRPDQLVWAALYFHPDIPLARSQLAVAQAQSVTARAAPPVSWNGSIGRASGGIAASPWLIGAAIDFVLDVGRRAPLRAQQADALVRAAQADLRQAAWRVRAQVLDATLDLWTASTVAQSLSQQLAWQRKRVALFEQRLALGEGAGSEVRREQAMVDQRSVALAQAEADSAQARAHLARAVGVPPDALAQVPLDLEGFSRVPTLPSSAIDGSALDMALRDRADVREAFAQLEAAQAALQIESTRRWPDLHLGPGVQFDQGAHKYVLNFGADNLRSSEGPIAEALAQRDRAAATLLALQSKVIGAVAEVAATWPAHASALQAAEQWQGRASAQERQSAAQWAAGRLDHPAWLAVQSERVDADLARHAALTRLWRNRIAFEDALQSTFDPGTTHFPEPL